MLPSAHNGEEGLGWTVRPRFDEMRANVHVHSEGPIRDAFREAFGGSEVYITLTAFR